MPRKPKQQRFYRAYCVDCARYLLQSFDGRDVEKMARLHGDMCNHETYTDEAAPREPEALYV